jgi:hypothetical protein
MDGNLRRTGAELGCIIDWNGFGTSMDLNFPSSILASKVDDGCIYEL